MNKLYQLLGLAMRAGKIISGEYLVLREVRSGKVHLVLLATDAAKNTEKKITDKCFTYKVPIIRYGTRQELGKAIGKVERVVIAVTDPGFARSIQKFVQ
ncbi:YlxQ family RNA-binding protein [Paenactinomyces guangxiensis]|uniref:YlxQ family RNA-binding protein n=1 Tax=Paenactinomyces guangxiensis TaxID=1490290 RepID=A0A7W2A7B7_9BACL|nr:YlxQ family RNA-binding protein [Paenactinomyces guangxiensis]MBA4494371.1 YlxQ family RNA-binding protein [Paenactinomyces guangxiensis]MBH8591574.1 YlxQ family RNA-binding protein [Paenactinomyces guangxiensis]